MIWADRHPCPIPTRQFPGHPRPCLAQTGWLHGLPAVVACPLSRPSCRLSAHGHCLFLPPHSVVQPQANAPGDDRPVVTAHSTTLLFFRPRLNRRHTPATRSAPGPADRRTFVRYNPDTPATDGCPPNLAGFSCVLSRRPVDNLPKRFRAAQTDSAYRPCTENQRGRDRALMDAA